MNEQLQPVAVDMFDKLGGINTPTALELLRSGRVSTERIEKIRQSLQEQSAREQYTVARQSEAKRQITEQVKEEADGTT